MNVDKSVFRRVRNTDLGF